MLKLVLLCGLLAFALAEEADKKAEEKPKKEVPPVFHVPGFAYTAGGHFVPPVVPVPGFFSQPPLVADHPAQNPYFNFLGLSGIDAVRHAENQGGKKAVPEEKKEDAKSE